MSRKTNLADMRKALIILSVVVALGIAWIVLFTGTPLWGPKLKLQQTDVKSIDLWWVGTNRTISDSNQCASVVETMQKAARYSQVGATPLFGTLTFHYADGTTNQFFLAQSGRFSALEISDGKAGYAISMDEMLRAFKSVGLLGNEN
jgi:hypothetical protein